MFIASRSSAVRGEFPGIAAFALLVLLLALSAAALVALRPWETDALVPDLRIDPGLEVALGDAVAVASPPPVRVADADIAGMGGPTIAVARVAAPQRPPAPQLDVSRGRVVLAAVPAPTTPPPTTPQPPAEPQPVPPPTPVSEPAPAPPPPPTFVAGGGSPSGGGTAGAPDPDPGQVCEGDEYEITIQFDPEAVADEDELEVFIRQVESDGSESEIHLEGKWADVRDLIELLLSEGNCVKVEFEPIGEGESPEEDPEVPSDVAVVGDTLEPVLP